MQSRTSGVHHLVILEVDTFGKIPSLFNIGFEAGRSLASVVIDKYELRTVIKQQRIKLFDHTEV